MNSSVYVVAGECDLSFTLHAVAFTSILHQSHSSPFVNATYAVIRSHSHDMWRRHTFASPDPFSVDYIHTHSTACKTYSPIHADSHAYSSSHIPTHKISFGTIREHSARSRPRADGVDQECELVGLVLARRGDVERVGDRVQLHRLDALVASEGLDKLRGLALVHLLDGLERLARVRQEGHHRVEGLLGAPLGQAHDEEARRPPAVGDPGGSPHAATRRLRV